MIFFFKADYMYISFIHDNRVQITLYIFSMMDLICSKWIAIIMMNLSTLWFLDTWSVRYVSSMLRTDLLYVYCIMHTASYRFQGTCSYHVLVQSSNIEINHYFFAVS